MQTEDKKGTQQWTNSAMNNKGQLKQFKLIHTLTSVHF